MTLEAWVNPTTVVERWRDVIYKGDDNYYLEGTSSRGGQPGRRRHIRRRDDVTATAPRPRREHLDTPRRRPTTARRCASTSTARRSRAGEDRRASPPRRTRSQIGGDSHLRPVLQRAGSTRCAIYNTALSGADPGRHGDRRSAAAARGHHAADGLDHVSRERRQVGDIERQRPNASDNVGVVGVQFYVDGAAVGAEDTTRPVRTAWDTRAGRERQPTR